MSNKRVQPSFHQGQVECDAMHWSGDDFISVPDRQPFLGVPVQVKNFKGKGFEILLISVFLQIQTLKMPNSSLLTAPFFF